MKAYSKTFTLTARALAGLLFTPAVFAHTFGAHGAGFAEGLAHPFLGLDHTLAMIAVGLWAAQLGGQALWRVPVVFLLAMAVGACIANPAIESAALEKAVGGSVMALGLLVALALRLPAWSAMLLVGFFALIHGFAHGLEIPQTVSPMGYGLGFLLATASLHLTGLLLGLALGRFRLASLAGGSAIAISGLLLLAV